MTEAAMKSVYEQIGGEPAMAAAVDVFYRKVLSDDRISHFFEDVDMERQAAKQKAFLTMVTGGPSRYSGRDMRAGHAHLVAQGLNDMHFDAVAGHLKETLEELGVPAPLVARVLTIAESARADVLNR
ncbi:group 1 truncated hemoglobin [Pyxidicoccus parkwayensis]|uniref:Group 1 truncated hemoglobin n=1 Tax=Pyxidicoccus parkwayensis TaxID=2813578 RepID=A0ABX7NXS2_9BACT|nr:group 1 truncated hemoglobin [Pyxidicoccus parkwaysis]QSQ22240.1 group 1 truncated hemoglobin [Pyxidicoccus parkwaysis]